MTGLAALAADGPNALAAEPLARRLGTTKGSFYWHFDDLPAFQAAVIDCWEDTTGALDMTSTDEAQCEATRLRLFAQSIGDTHAEDTPAGPGAHAPVEPAMRAWALSHTGAAAAVARVDARRLDHMGQLLNAIGISNPEMARIIYGAGLGMEALGPEGAERNKGAIGSLVDLVLALR